jgi:queuosine precursor transporter
MLGFRIKNTAFNREALYLILCSIFLTSLIVANLVGTTKFIHLFSLRIPSWLLPLVPAMVRNGDIYAMIVPAGLIAFPLTFLATDLISEIFGRKKAQLLVWVGLGVNIFMILLMYINFRLPNAEGVSAGLHLFDGVYSYMVGNTMASMLAYLTAQTIDVRLFHYWKKRTGGKHLWLRNNASTMISQLVDSIAIMSILYFAGHLGESVIGIKGLMILIINAYIFKFFAALLDTPVMYAVVALLKDFEDEPSETQ